MDIDVAAATDISELVEVVASAFAIPYPVGGPDGLIDWLSDLDWLEPVGGHVVTIDGLDVAPAEVRSEAAAITPFILDRWREAHREKPYVFVLVAAKNADEVAATVRESNTRLDEIGRTDTITNTASVELQVVLGPAS